MALSQEKCLTIQSFLDRADFGRGGVFLDLDGVALLEVEGRIAISSSVVRGLADLVSLGRPVIMNTLRFPLSVIRTVASEWLGIYGGKLPAVLLNGSLIGYIGQRDDALEWQEEAAFPLRNDEIRDIVKGVRQLLDNGIRDIVLFAYPRDWREGELVWTPNESHVEPLRDRYFSASNVVAWHLPDLEKWLMGTDICMMHLYMDRPYETLMAYQHSKPSSFFTQEGVDKASGTREMATRLGLSLPDSIGAGDTEMDIFLGVLGLAVLVGGKELPYRGLRETMRVEGPQEVGELLGEIAGLMRERRRSLGR